MGWLEEKSDVFGVSNVLQHLFLEFSFFVSKKVFACFWNILELALNIGNDLRRQVLPEPGEGGAIS